MESLIIFGLLAASNSEITIDNGRGEQTNFRDYPVLRVIEVPKMLYFSIRKLSGAIRLDLRF